MRGMILAAGLGTRLRPLTDHYPKPALPFLNVPLVYYSKNLLEHGGVTDLVVNTHHLAAQVRELFSPAHSQPPSPAVKSFKNIHFSHETPEILNSGGGIRQARRWLEGEGCFLAANGDEILIPPAEDILEKLTENHRRSGALATLLVMEHPEVGKKFGGVWVDTTGRVMGFGKVPSQAGLQGLHFTGFQCLSDRVFSFISEGTPNIFYDVLVQAIAQGELVRVLKIESALWVETGNPHDYLQAHEVLLNELLKKRVPQLQKFLENHWAAATPRENFWRGAGVTGLTWAEQKTRYLDRGVPVLLGANSHVDPVCEISGFLVMGDGARLEKSPHLGATRVERVVMGERAHTNLQQEMKSKIITSACSVG